MRKQGMTLERIARRWKISRERVRQILENMEKNKGLDNIQN